MARGVQIAVTPQGVEHDSHRYTTGHDRTVQIAVTPQGVEHKSHMAEIESRSSVQIAVTPQGVEHAHLPAVANAGADRADRSDAARR